MDSAELTLAPVTPAAAPVILYEELKDLRTAVAVRAPRALGGSAELVGEELAQARLGVPRSAPIRQHLDDLKRVVVDLPLH